MTRPADAKTPAFGGLALLVGALALCGLASAASLNGVDSGSLSAGVAPVVDCDGDGFTVIQTLVGPTVTDLTVGDIHTGCAGGSLSVTLTDLLGVAVLGAGPVTVPGGGGSVVVAMTSSVDVSAFVSHRLLVVGPLGRAASPSLLPVSSWWPLRPCCGRPVMRQASRWMRAT